jgi:hypothetical protein
MTMNGNTYNGWANRETWLVNLYFGEDSSYIEEMCEDARGDVDTLAEMIKEMVQDYIDEQTTNGFVRDLLNDSAIDYDELAGTWMAEYKIEEEQYEEETEDYDPYYTLENE